MAQQLAHVVLACTRRCGQLGHLTKQCRNQFSRFFDNGASTSADIHTEDAATAAAAGRGPGNAAGAAGMLPGLDAEGPELSSDLGSLLTDSSDSSTDSEEERRRHKVPNSQHINQQILNRSVSSATSIYCALSILDVMLGTALLLCAGVLTVRDVPSHNDECESPEGFRAITRVMIPVL